MCRDIARLIVSKKNLLDLFKDKVELAAMIDCALNHDPQANYAYAYSYDPIMKMVLLFETKPMPIWITPNIHPNGKMTDTSPAAKSRAISNIKGQLRIDRGAKVRDERVAGFYAWLNAYHPKPCEELHEALSNMLGNEIELEFPNIIPENRGGGKTPKNSTWRKLLSENQDEQRVTFISYKDFSFNLVELSRAIKKDMQAFEIDDEFLFGVDSPFDGHVIALQIYKGKTFALPLSTSAGLTVLNQGQNFYPADQEEDEVIPLSENTDLGVHKFLFFLFAGTPPHFDYTPLYEAGAAIHPETLEALAVKLLAYQKHQWRLCQTHINFS